MDKPWSEDIEDSGFPEDFGDESPDEDKSTSGKFQSDGSCRVERRSNESSTDSSVINGSEGSKSYARSLYNDNTPSAESEYHLLNLLANSGFPMTQINGQRKLGPPPGWTKPPPDPSCEVFVGKIPRNLYEHEIYPVFRKIGDVYEIRLMMDFSGTNRGYCFVMFTNIEDARRAIKELNNYPIRPGRQIGVVASINNCRLCVGQLPNDVGCEAVIKKFYETTDDVSKVAVYKYPNGQVRCALVSYNTHRGAAMARRRLLPERGCLFANAEISVDWAHPNKCFNNLVEVIGKRDEAGNLRIMESTLAHPTKRRAHQRQSSDDFLDKSIKIYLQDRGSPHLNNQRKSFSRGNSFSGKRKFNRAINGKSSDADNSRDRFSVNDSPTFNRLRSTLGNPKKNDNHMMGNDVGLCYSKNFDVNGNYASSNDSRGLLNTTINLINDDNLDGLKMEKLSITKSKNDPTASISNPSNGDSTKKPMDGPLRFNVFEHYAQHSDEILKNHREVQNFHEHENNSQNGERASWTKFVSNNTQPVDAIVNNDPPNFSNDQSQISNGFANFSEFSKSIEDENFVARSIISDRSTNDSTYSCRNQRRNFQSRDNNEGSWKNKILPDYRVFTPLINWNKNVDIPNESLESRISLENFHDDEKKISKKQNFDRQTVQNGRLTFSRDENFDGNHRRSNVERFDATQRQKMFNNGNFVDHHRQTDLRNPREFDEQLWWPFNDPRRNQRSPIDFRQFSGFTNFPPRGLFYTSSFGNFYRIPTQICGNIGEHFSHRSSRPNFSHRCTVGDN